MTPRLKRFAAIFTLALVAVVLCWQGWGFYKKVRGQLFVKRGHTAMMDGDDKSAVFWAGRALQSDPENVEACRLMADLSDRENASEALLWRAQIARMEPGRPENYLDWAKTALRVKNSDAAAYALSQFPESQRGTSAGYHELMAAWALSTGQAALGDFHFSEAARIDPANPLHAVNLATLRLSAAGPGVVAQAKSDMEKYASQPGSAVPALRALLLDALRKRDMTHAMQFSEKLQVTPGHDFGDLLLGLDAMAGEPQFPIQMSAVQSQAEKSLGDTLLMAQWMMRHNLSANLLSWLRSLPKEIQAQPAISISMGDAMTILKDWEGLKNFTATGDWGKVDFLRRAMEAHALKEMNSDLFSQHWNSLVQAEENNPDSSLLLAQMAQAWGWDDQAEEIWWGLTRKRVLWHQQALEKLWAFYSAKKDTANLLRVARQQYTDNPDDLVALNNYAFLSLLLASNPATANRLATDAWKQKPLLPEIASTYAYSQLQKGDAAGGLKALNALDEQVREKPEVALYYALLLHANGFDEKARYYLRLSAAASLLPEEQRIRAELAKKLTLERQSATGGNIDLPSK